MFKSKNVRHGDLVCYGAGHKLVRCGRGRTPLGVYRSANTLTLLTNNDYQFNVYEPEAVILRGVSTAVKR